jgi:hypothetical protein
VVDSSKKRNLIFIPDCLDYVLGGVAQLFFHQMDLLSLHWRSLSGALLRQSDEMIRAAEWPIFLFTAIPQSILVGKQRGKLQE